MLCGDWRRTSVTGAHRCSFTRLPQGVQNRLRTEINETRFFVSSPPYLDVAIVFRIFLWAGMERRPGTQPRD
jgi:hypothetical protein